MSFSLLSSVDENPGSNEKAAGNGDSINHDVPPVHESQHSIARNNENLIAQFRSNVLSDEGYLDSTLPLPTRLYKPG
ncbi:MAG: hypothetical protein ACR5KV_00330 [Wolbachia sp.]